MRKRGITLVRVKLTTCVYSVGLPLLSMDGTGKRDSACYQRLDESLSREECGGCVGYTVQTRMCSMRRGIATQPRFSKREEMQSQ